MKKYKSITKMNADEFKSIVLNSDSIKEVGQKLGYTKMNGGTYKVLRNRISELGLSLDHMTRSVKPKTYTHETIFCKNSTYNSSNSLKRRAREAGVPYKCAICGMEATWNGKDLTLIIDHINGDHFDNRLENLRFVCPNCNSQLDTFGSRNKIKYHKPVVEKKIKRCIDCGTPIDKNAIRCRDCYEKIMQENSLMVPKEILEEDLKTLPFLAIGKKYNVSDNAIRKWCKKYGLPSSAKEVRTWRNS